MSGAEMLLQSALKAFVPKETAEKLQQTLEGMLKDGTLDGIAALVSDIQEIKRSQARIEFGLARIFAEVQGGQQILALGNGDGISGSPAARFGDAPFTEHRTDGRPCGSECASGEPDAGYDNGISAVGGA